MKMWCMGAAVCATLILAAYYGGQAVSQQSNPPTRDTAGQQSGAQPMTCCPMCMMMGGQRMGPEMMKRMMGQMGMTPAVMEQMQLLMRTPVFLDAPGVISSQADKLGLSEEQKKKLGEIEREARQKARAVLTPEQQAKLGHVPTKPVTMMETCPMMKMMGEKGPESGCPCMKMMQMMESKDGRTREKGEKEKSKPSKE